MKAFDSIIKSNLGIDLASALGKVLQGAAVGEPLDWNPASDLAYMLQLFIPGLLRERYCEWKSESLDAIFCSQALKTGDEAARLVGTCILITDQTVTPFMLDIELEDQARRVNSFSLAIGEQGVGKLGISGPRYGSSKAGLLLLNLNYRLDGVCWTYKITNADDGRGL